VSHRRPCLRRDCGFLRHNSAGARQKYKLSEDDERLEADLESLHWKESKFNAKSRWVPKDAMPTHLKTALEQHHGRFSGDEFTYYLARSGTVTKYSKSGTVTDSESSYPIEEEPKPESRLNVGAKEKAYLCPECGEPMDREHRGQHNHA
jgi:hypothetical protein